VNRERAKQLRKQFVGRDAEKETTVELDDMSDLTVLGECFAVEYIAKKHTDKTENRYRHEFESGQLLLTNGKELIIFCPTGKMKITERGIEK